MSNPWNDLLPTEMEVAGTRYEIRSDYRAALDICAALSDPELDGQERALVALYILYPGFEEMPPEHYQQALEQCLWFLRCGEEEQEGPAPRLVDWKQDFPHIVAPINRVIGKEVRAVEYMHWWTFIAAYCEIGDCLFAQIVRIREKRQKGKPLDKAEREFYRKNQKLVDLKTIYTQQDEAVIGPWLGK